MKLEVRQKRIEALRKKGLTYQEIGDKFNISQERVRQLLTYKIEYCERHSRKYLGECLYCKTENDYVDKVKHILNDNLGDEINRLLEPSRKKEIVMQRAAVIKHLKDDYSLSFAQIGRLLNRHESSIKNLYFKKI